MRQRSSPGRPCCSSRPPEPCDACSTSSWSPIAARSRCASSTRRRSLGCSTVAVFSEADRESLAVRYADEAVCIGPPPASQELSQRRRDHRRRPPDRRRRHPSRLRLSFRERQVCRSGGCGRPRLRRPRRRKRSAPWATRRRRARRRRPPAFRSCPAARARSTDLDACTGRRAATSAIPVMIKASAGGGGRGIRVADDEAGLAQHFPTAQAEAAAAFGNGALYLERFLRQRAPPRSAGAGRRRTRRALLRARMLAAAAAAEDLGGGAVAGDRRRRRAQALCASAVRLAERARYRGAGTLEYLYDDDTRRILLHRDEHAHPGRASRSPR